MQLESNFYCPKMKYIAALNISVNCYLPVSSVLSGVGIFSLIIVVFGWFTLQLQRCNGKQSCVNSDSVITTSHK